MNTIPSCCSARPVLRRSYLLSVNLIALTTAILTGCGGAVTSQSSGSNLSGNTTVTVLTTSTANDHLSKIILGDINNITLTSKAGNSVTLLTTPLSAEFLHVNGTEEPLSTMSIPQDTYTSATMSVGDASFTCISFDSSTGNLVTNQMASGQLLPSQINVKLPSPITISGSSMGLFLDLQASQSAVFSSCDDSNYNYSITPTFILSPANIAPHPANSISANSKGILGMIGSVYPSGKGFVVNAVAAYFDETSVYGPSWQVTTNPSTTYQGISDLSQLIPGMPVDIDGEVQPDGSLLATRIAVYDPNAVNLTVSSGPLLFVSEYEPTLMNFGAEGQGLLIGLNAFKFDFSDAIFQMSGQLSNLKQLPFTARFSPEDMVAGQNILLTSHALTGFGESMFPPAATITLRPQTINGTVSAIGSEGSFTTYTITLAPYDLFPTLAVQGGQTTLLTNPNTVVVYADSSAQMLNANPIKVGGMARFYGLVFNDNGALRMDCAEILDGVAE